MLVVYCLAMLQGVNYKYVEELSPLTWEFKATVIFLENCWVEVGIKAADLMLRHRDREKETHGKTRDPVRTAIMGTYQFQLIHY